MALNNEHETETSEPKKKNGCLIAFLGVTGYLFFAFIFSQFNGGDILFLYITIAALIVFFIYMIYLAVTGNSKRKNDKAETNKKYHASISGSIQHFEGLPIPRGVFISLYYGNDKITLVKEHQEISLDLSKIISMDIVRGNDIQSQATGAIAGGLLLGGLSGAVIGALVSTKTYFVISYKSDNENKTIIFDTSGGEISGNKLDVFKVLNAFKSKYNRETEKIEL